MNNRFVSLFFVLFAMILWSCFGYSAEAGIPIQLKMKSPSGIYPSENGISVKLQLLSADSRCVLLEETFSNQNLVDGALSLVLSHGVRGGYDQALSLAQALDNSIVKMGLTCLDVNGNVASTNQSYTPAAQDVRIIRLSTTVASEAISFEFPLRSVGYSVHAENVAGKKGTDLMVQNTSTSLSQANLETLLANATKLNNLLNIANGGAVSTALNANQAANATHADAATTADSFTGALAGDISGGQSATVVNRIKGIPVSSIVPSAGQFLKYDGSQYVPATLPAQNVMSVAGKTGHVTLNLSDISGTASLMDQSVFNGYVLSAGCSSIQTLYWNSVTSSFQCQDIGLIPLSQQANQVVGVFSGDISGTQSSISVDKLKSVPVSATAPVAGQAMAYDGAQWAPAAGLPQLVKLSSDQTYSTTTLADVASLAFNVVAGKVYKFKFNILYTAAATTTGIRLGLTYPTVTSSSALVIVPGATADGTGNIFSGTINSSGDSVLSANTQAASPALNFGTIEGIIVPSASGLVQLRVASEVAASNVIIKAGTFIEVLQVP